MSTYIQFCFTILKFVYDDDDDEEEEEEEDHTSFI